MNLRNSTEVMVIRILNGGLSSWLEGRINEI